MSVRFDADGESYTRSTGLGSVTVWSFACWVKLAVDQATTTVLLQIDNGSGTSRLRINAWNGTALTYQTDGGGWFGTIGHTLTVGAWSYVGISGTSNPGEVRSAARAAGSTTWAGGTSSQTNATFNAATLRIGDGQAANEWLNGSLAAVKIWDQALSFEELQQESWTYLPKRTAGLRGWYPFLSPSTTDYSGLAQTLSGGTGAALDDPPPITWSAGRRRIFIPSGTSVTLADTATADDQLTTSAAAPLDETAAATDALIAAASTTLTESITGTEAFTVDVTAALAEGVTVTDDISSGSPVDLADTATITDDLAALPTPVLDEPIAGTDTLAVTATTGLTESVTAADVLAVSEISFKDLADTVAATDALTVVVLEDLTFTAKPLRRGWTSPGPARAWSGDDIERGWTSRALTT